MPKHAFKPEDPMRDMAPRSGKSKKRLPQEHFHSLPNELVKGLKIGGEVTVTIKGKVRSISTREDMESADSDASLGVEMKSIEIYGSNEFSDMAEDES